MAHATDTIPAGLEGGAKRRRGSKAIFHVRPLLIAAALLGACGLAYGSWVAIVSAGLIIALSLPLGIVIHTTAGHDREKTDRPCG